MRASNDIRILDQDLTPYTPRTADRQAVRSDPPPVAVDVLMLTRAADREADFLVMTLQAIGITVHRVDIDHPPALDITFDDDKPSVSLNGRPTDPCVVLLRYFSPAATGVVGDAMS